MDERFKNSGSPLGRFIEECGEALAAAGKTVRYGWLSRNPLPGASSETNEEWLKREVADLEDAIERLKREKGWSNASPADPRREREAVEAALKESAKKDEPLLAAAFRALNQSRLDLEWGKWTVEQIKKLEAEIVRLKGGGDAPKLL